ncbi:MAG: ribonuclease Z [bacterium]|nr:ribonuclease Z [bacterium]
MKLTFAGVGAAFDPLLYTTSSLVEHAGFRLMVDCGYASLGSSLECDSQLSEIDALYLTHFHADHTFGLPALLGIMAERKRTHPFSICGQNGTEAYVQKLMQVAYPGLLKNLPFRLLFRESDIALELGPLLLEFARSLHPMKNMSVKINAGPLKLGISGDGAMTDETKLLLSDCDFLVHECYSPTERIPGHEAFQPLMSEIAHFGGLRELFLVHVFPDHREVIRQMAIKNSDRDNLIIRLPEPSSCFSLS